MADYDKLTIKIVANTGGAIESIKNLSSRLDTLEKQTKEMDFERLNELQNILQGIASIDFTKTSNSLYSLVKSFEKLNTKTIENANNYVENLELPELDLGSGLEDTFEVAVDGFKEITQTSKESASAVSSFTSEIKNATESLKTDELDEFSTALSNIGLQTPQIQAVLKALKTETSKLSPQQIKEVEKTMRDLGYSAKDTAKTIELVKKASETSHSGLSKLATKFKSLALYRVMRLVLMEIQKSLQQSFQQLALVDSKFNSSVSEIKNSLGFLSRSIISLVAPILEAIAPIISSIANTIGEVIGKLGQAFGGDTFSKAEKSADDYAESLKKVKDTALGIDELNVIKQEDQGTYFSSVNNENASAFQETMGKISGVIGKLTERLSSTLEKLMPYITKIINAVLRCVDKLLPAINKIFDVVFDVLDQLLPPIMDLITRIVSIVGEIIEILAPIISALVDVFRPIIEMISFAVSEIVELLYHISPVLSIIGVMLKFMLVPTMAVLAALETIFEVLKGVFITFYKIFTFDFSSIGEEWEDTGNRIANAWRRVAEAQQQVNTNLMPKAYATGGFVEDGLFFANHNELIGEFSNGQTAVANNEQIVEGIKQGVFEAMTMASGNNQDGTPSIKVYLDSTEIAKRVEQRTLARKDNNIVGGYKYGG